MYHDLKPSQETETMLLLTALAFLAVLVVLVFILPS